MKQMPAEKKIADRMAPGALSAEGFTGPDPRRYLEIIDADLAEMERLGVDPAALADRLEEIAEEAVAGLGTPVQVGEHLDATWHEAMGRIPCPFGKCGTFRKGDVELTDGRTGDTLRFTRLSVHMLREHGFCQGRGTRYRLEPAALAQMLG
jgi:hypothetical protein